MAYFNEYQFAAALYCDGFISLHMFTREHQPVIDELRAECLDNRVIVLC